MRFTTVLIAASLTVVTSTAALADHGKVGLWQVTTTMKMPGMPSASQTYTSQHCMTADEVKMNKMPTGSNADCKMVNEKTDGHSFSGDMVCTGRATGNGHIQVNYDTDTHYAGQMTMTSTADGQTMHMANTFEGKWLSADCGKIAH